MKKLISLLVVPIFILTVGLALAEEMKGSMMGGEGKGSMMGEGMMKGMMGKSSMVASNDGGVIVLLGNKLYKYDKNLNLVKEVELKVDMCMMKHKGSMTEDVSEGQETQPDAQPSEHESHH